MRLSNWLLLAAVVSAGGVLAAPNPRLQAAKKLIDDLEFEAAARMLNDAAEVPNNERVVVLEILELQGITWGTLGRAEKARDAFCTLLLLDPTYALPRDQPPRVRAPLAAAKRLVGENALTLESEVRRGKGALEAEVIEEVRVKVKNDMSNLGRVLSFHVAVGDKVRTERVKPDLEGQARVKVGAPQVRWWVKLLGARDAVLLELGSSTNPMEESPPLVIAPLEALPPLVIAPLEALPPPVIPLAVAPRQQWRRPTGIALLGSGALAAGIGAVFGIQSQDAHSKVRAALKDGGLITSMTQREAAALDAQARSAATRANVLLGAGAAMMAAGLVLTLTAGASEIVVAPAPGGSTISGHF